MRALRFDKPRKARSRHPHLLCPDTDYLSKLGVDKGCIFRCEFTAYLADVIILLTAAIAAVPLFRALGLGAVPGLLMAGILVGPSGLGCVKKTLFAKKEWFFRKVDACRIPLATAKALQSKHPELCNQVRQHLQDHLDRADEWIIALGAGPARERVAHLLLMLGQFSTDPNGDIGLLGREDMAAIVGTSVETVSRIIAEFKRGHLLHKVTEDLYRCDREALQAIAGAAAG